MDAAPRTQFWLPAAAGFASLLCGIGAAELTASVIAPSGSPVIAVGSAIIDLVPAWLKNLVIGLFGTGDKAVLLVTLAIVLALGAALAGVVEDRRPPWGRVLFVAGSALGVLAALTRSGASPLDAVPSIVAMIVAVFLLTYLVSRVRTTRPTRLAPAGAMSRRRFLVTTGSAAGAGILAIVAGQVISAGYRTATAARALFKLPTPAVAAAPVAADASFAVPGLSAIVTPNTDFYRIDTALELPAVDPSSWTLRIHGMVAHEVTLTFAQLLALPLEESYTTLTCVSNPVGGNLISNAKWLGYPIRHLLEKAQPLASADMVLSKSQDGWTAGTPIEALTDDRNAILAVGMNGQPLPVEHGYPVRMVVPGLYGYVSATKWVVDLEVTRFDKATAYWTDRGWSARGPVKLESRIDVPVVGAPVKRGDVVVAGVAWSQHVGLSGVQVQVDNGAWNDATLASAISADTWRQWRWVWSSATPGQHAVAVRAIDANGRVQTSTVADVIPDGATGLHEISVTVS